MLNKIFKDNPVINLNIQYKGSKIGEVEVHHGIDRNSIFTKSGMMYYSQDGKEYAVSMTSINNACFYVLPDKEHYLWFCPDKNLAMEYKPNRKPKAYSIN
jgi:hypothetical protein